MRPPLSAVAALALAAAGALAQVTPEKPIRPLPARPSDLLERGDSGPAGRGAFETPEAAVTAGKVALGEGLDAGSDPKRRLDGFQRARAAFEAALAFGVASPKVVRDEAEAFLAEIVKELPASASASKAVKFDVLVLGVELERKSFEFDSGKYGDLFRKLEKAGKAEDPIEVQKARQASTKTVTLRTEWTSKDDALARKALADARREVQRLSKGRLDFEWTVAKHPTRAPDETQDRFGSRRWTLNPLHPWEDEFGRGLAEAVLKQERRPDFVFVLPKIERRGERLPSPAFEDELRYPLPALGGGLVGVLHMAIGEDDDARAKGADGSAANRPPTLAEKFVAGLYALLRDRVPAASGGDSGLPEIPGSGADGLVTDRRRRAEVAVERARFLESAYAERLSDSMLRALAERNRTFARRTVPETADPAFAALFDADLGTAVTLRPGEPVVVALKRAVEIRGIAFAGSAVPAESARRLSVTIDDGSTLFALQAFSGERTIEKYDLDAPVRVASIRIFSDSSAPRDLAEIVLSGR